MWLLRDFRSVQGPDLGSPGSDGAGEDLLDIRRIPPTTWHLTETSRLDGRAPGRTLLDLQAELDGRSWILSLSIWVEESTPYPGLRAMSSA